MILMQLSNKLERIAYEQLTECSYNCADKQLQFDVF